MRVRLVLTALGLVIATAACGGSSKPAESSGTPTTVHIANVAANEPSISAKMICAPEAVKDINEIFGETARISTPTWVDHVYSCDYSFGRGAKMTLSVKELSSVDETTAYYDTLARKLGKKSQLNGFGDGAFITSNGSVVTRKDYKVMTVDTSHLPAQFAGDTRENQAINVTATIMSCWTGE